MSSLNPVPTASSYLLVTGSTLLVLFTAEIFVFCNRTVIEATYMMLTCCLFFKNIDRNPIVLIY
jgi:hypothetical protein